MVRSLKRSRDIQISGALGYELSLVTEIVIIGGKQERFVGKISQMLPL